MLKYLFEIFCKETTVGLCSLEKDKNQPGSGFYSGLISYNKDTASVFRKSIAIGQTVYHL